MAKPQQPELRRSERVPALDPDASEAVLSAETVPSPTDPDGPVPEEQRPGHQPDDVQDKPDMDAMAERLGIATEGDEPADAPRVTESGTSEPETREPAAITAIRARRRSLALAIGVAAAAAVVVRQVLRRRR